MNLCDDMHRLVFEVLKNSIEEAAEGYCSKIEINLLPDNVVSIADDGRGIPLDVKGVIQEEVLNNILAGAPITKLEYARMGDLPLDSLKVVNSLCESLTIKVYRGGKCYQIDSGVAGCQDIIIEVLHRIGKDISDIKGIFLTHAHPDHIGTAAWFKEKTGCRVYADEGDKPWIEDIDLQFAQRPIPNFYKLAGKSVQVDCILHDGDEITLEKDIALKVVSTPGHSAHELSFQIGSYAFIGDCIPVKGDIPIYIDAHAAIDSINKIKNMVGIDVFYPAWDTVYSADEIYKKAAEGIEIIGMIEQAVQKIKTNSGDKGLSNKELSNMKLSDMELSVLVCEVCRELEMPWLAANPLFAKTIHSHLRFR